MNVGWGAFSFYRGLSTMAAGVAATITGVGAPVGAAATVVAAYQMVSGGAKMARGFRQIGEGFSQGCSSDCGFGGNADRAFWGIVPGGPFIRWPLFGETPDAVELLGSFW